MKMVLHRLLDARLMIQEINSVILIVLDEKNLPMRGAVTGGLVFKVN